MYMCVCAYVCIVFYRTCIKEIRPHRVVPIQTQLLIIVIYIFCSKNLQNQLYRGTL